MHGSTAWVTGGGRGIGAGVAAHLAARGARVWITSRNQADCEKVAAAIRAAGGLAEAAPGDVADPAQMAAVAARIAAAGGRLDHLVCSAGVGIYGPLDTFDVQALDRMLAVNVRGTLVCAQAALALMRPRRSGAIIGIASVMAVTGYRNQGGYAASKHAMLGLLRVLAKEVQPDGIRVSCLCPGAVDTEMIRNSRPDLDPMTVMGVEDVAAAVAWLLSLPERCAVDVLHLRRRNAEPFAV